MKKLNVGLGKNSYDILIGENYAKDFPKYIKEIYSGEKLFVITDSNVNEIYKNIYEKMFNGFDYTVYVLKAGEKNKHIGIMPEIYSAMVEAGVKRKDLVVAFGGGVVGDIAGFAAASFLRGVNFIQIPTTIVSQVDSSVGGKVGVDLPEGKNLVGAFYQPKLVLIDNYFLNTLTDRYFYDGFGEIVKYGCIYDKKFFDRLVEIVETVEISYDDKNYKKKLREHLMKYVNELVYRSCEIKKEVVEKDEKEQNLRMILNFGHTIGHAIEQFTNYEKYSHGEAISAGMVDITKIGEKKGFTKEGEAVKIAKLLKALNLPTEIEYPKNEISEIMKRDKKSTSDGINFVILKEIGEVEIMKIGAEKIFE
ncbi:3-dehydroquinate synthase [Leptotrichia sp. oral taxon 847]|uniref:3-dehydroquinate synthase n=1 Tax=Leptotrichia sp. oral taxon 847 TaxID=1785996 RepID=UPI0007680CAF|nr:3-dehydroquinate synthase [Leptotrichia sp. oral taxon 847]AMD94885.1 3-dehydroquinate synthase [Leptotrichia sp. oral taxon 847]